MPAFTQITDEGFPGAKSIDFLGQMIVGVEPLGRFWFHSALADATSYNTLDRYQAETSPDRIMGLIASNNQVLVFGERTIEPWVFAPTETASFQLQTGSVIESGCASGDTIKRLDNAVFYLTNNGQIARLNGYTPQVISTVAIESAIRELKWSRAFAEVWEDNGHAVYYITFPDGHTWGYDVRQNRWHRRESYGMDRWRINALCKSNGKWIAGDYANGRIYELEHGNVYEGCEIMPRKIRTGVLHSLTNRVQVHGLKIVAATGLPPKMPQQVQVVEESPAAVLITGNDGGLGSTPFLSCLAEEHPTIVNIPTSTGADINNARCSVNEDGMFIAVAEDELLYSTDINSSWTSVATAYPTNTGRFAVHGPDGWLIQYEGDSYTGLLASATTPPTDAAALTINIAGGDTLTSLSWIKYVDGKYWGCFGFSDSYLLVNCETLDGEWQVVTSQAGSITDGSDSVRFFYDIEKFDGALYAACYTASDVGGLGGGDCLRKSTDNGATWNTVLVDGRVDADVKPFQLAQGNGILIAFNRDATTAYTSVDGFSEAHATGVSRGIADLPRNEKEGRYVAYASRRFLVMGDTSLATTLDGITFATPSEYPPYFINPVSIAAFSDPEETPIPIPEECTPMEGGVFQMRYAKDGAANYSNWRDFEAPRTGHFMQPLIARRLGMARHWVMEIMDTSNRPQDVLALAIHADTE